MYTNEELMEAIIRYTIDDCFKREVKSVTDADQFDYRFQMHTKFYKITRELSWNMYSIVILSLDQIERLDGDKDDLLSNGAFGQFIKVFDAHYETLFRAYWGDLWYKSAYKADNNPPRKGS